MKEQTKLVRTGMKLVYDVKSTPQGLDISNLVSIFNGHHVVFWDSSNGGTKPKLYSDEDLEATLAVVDTKGVEMDFQRYHDEFADKEFWDKELYRCQSSPLYYATNYLTTVWPADDKEVADYIKSIGLVNIKNDAKDAQEQWAKQKELVKAAGKLIKLEDIKVLGGVVEGLKALYFENITALESLVKGKVTLYDSGNMPLPDKKRISNIVSKIRKFPVLDKYSKYKNGKGKWDYSMLFVTAYEPLLEMFYDVLLEDKNKKKG